MTDEALQTSDFTLTCPTEPLVRALTLLRRGARPALLLGLLAATAVFLIRTLAPASFTATATLLLAAPQQGLDSLGIVTPSAVDASAYRTLILDGPLLEQALIQLGEPADPAAAAELRRQLTISIQSQTISRVIRLAVRSEERRVGRE